MNSSYILFGLVVAVLVIIVLYFSKVEDEQPPVKKITKQDIEKQDNEVDLLKQRLNEQIIQNEREYQQTLMQIREAEKNRITEYNKQVDHLRTIEIQINKERDLLLAEKQEFVQQKIDAQKNANKEESEKPEKPKTTRKPRKTPSKSSTKK